MLDFSKRIYELRVLNNLTQPEFAQLVGVKKSTICNWEAGRNKPDIDKVVAICKTLNVSMDYLFLLETEQMTPASEFDSVAIPVVEEFDPNIPIPVNKSIEHYRFIKKPEDKHPSRFFYLRVWEDNMNRAGIEKGDLVLIEVVTKLKYGEIGLMLYDDEVYIRRLVNSKRVTFMTDEPINMVPTTVELKRKTDIGVLGKVIEVIKKID